MREREEERAPTAPEEVQSRAPQAGPGPRALFPPFLYGPNPLALLRARQLPLPRRDPTLPLRPRPQQLGSEGTAFDFSGENCGQGPTAFLPSGQSVAGGKRRE